MTGRKAKGMTEMTSVGSDARLELECACGTSTNQVNSLVELYRKESGDEGCICHNAS